MSKIEFVSYRIDVCLLENEKIKGFKFFSSFTDAQQEALAIQKYISDADIRIMKCIDTHHEEIVPWIVE